ncbi:MAG: EAL domain-containing protein [Rhodoplanes sp.]|uniref:bifunctional diguanylate cyclase/phosphodiesterase n=1 Tax=Rhodoplanes sp. TaxID=1968906 RepID=UPI00185CBB9D|nr:EAL domain-containing protein [Rhodoplanes sp.]NVO13212.1 EAL domain-containing protein [Rhodoplanes sp.]
MATGAVTLSIWQNRNDDIADAIRSDRNSAIFLAGQIEQVVQAIDNILRDYQTLAESLDVYSDQEFRQHFTPERRYTLRGSLLATLMRIPNANHLSVTDSEGTVVVSTHVSPTPLNMADRQYFQDLVANDDDRLSVSLPLDSRFTGEPVIVFARRINGHDRSFRGVVFLSLATRYLERTYRAAGFLRNQTFSLAHQDGSLIFRLPAPPESASRTIPPMDPWHATVAQRGGSFRASGLFDDSVRWISVQPAGNYPLVVSITVPEASILANWQSRSTITALGALGFVVCLVVLLMILARQFTVLSRSRADLAEANLALNAALDNMSHGLCMFDGAGFLRLCNERFLQIYGFPAAFVRGAHRTMIDEARRDRVVSEMPDARLLSRDDGPVSDPACLVSELDDDRFVKVSRQPLSYGGWLETHEDVTDRRRYEGRIEFLARCDPLTGTANRANFLERLHEEQTRARTLDRPVTVVMVDLDRFKEVNDSLGHAAGDLLLKTTAERLRACIRAEDTIARLGGDEFAILRPPPFECNLRTRDLTAIHADAVALADRIIAAVAEPYAIDDHKVAIGASVGLVIATDPADESIDLLKKADLALYQAKEQGRSGYCFFDKAMMERVETRHRLRTDLRQAIEDDEFVLHYQPLVDLVSGAVCGVEALVRWMHPERGLVPPDQFIPLAEQTGLIVPLGDWILKTACIEAATWPACVKLAVNISAVQFRSATLPDAIMQALADTGMAPERLEIEITESVLLDNEENNLSMLRRLKEAGISVALDDFGTGYSSLGYLTMFPFDKLKIDRSFTQDVLSRSDCMAIICAAATLGRSLGMTVLAEGIETHGQLELLCLAGVSQAQGYYFGRPVPAAEIGRTMRRAGSLQVSAGARG